MKRRRLIQLGALAASATGISTLAYKFLPPRPSKSLKPVQALTTELYESLSSALKKHFVVDYQHPYRQYHNRGIWAGGKLISLGGFSRHQLGLITDLMYAGLSDNGHDIVPQQFFQRLPDIMVNNLLICGDPHTPDYQVLFTGPHLNLRVGGKNAEGVAFGGPQVYGDQAGNKKAGLPGNIYQPQLVMATDIFAGLTPTQQTLALLEKSPIQTQVELQGERGQFTGVPVAQLAATSVKKIERLIEQIFKPYPETDVAYAWQCLHHNGGIKNLYLSYYQDSSYGDNSYQNFRLEGPAAVFYFKGLPHVHGFFNLAMDGNTPFSTGKILTTNPSLLVGEKLKRMFEQAMVAQQQTDFGFYNIDSVVGKLRAGEITTGDIYNAESWQNNIAVVSVKGSELKGEFSQQLLAQKIQLQSSKTYRIATTDYVANERLRESFGDAEKVSEGGLLRDEIIAYLAKGNLV